MANTVTRLVLSGSTHGRGIKLTGTNSAGAVTLHTAVNHATNSDEIFIEVYNSHTAAVDVTLEWGGTTAPDDNIKASIPPGQGLFRMAAGLPLRNNLVVKGFASVANVVTVFGYVNRVEVA
jgi:hypothetical protein